MGEPTTYVCAVCEGTFDKGWSDEEADAERAEQFPGFEQSDCDLVCDDCYKRMGFA